MDTFFLVILGFLALLAAIDLFVGVSNDASNFLNSAVGCRIAPYKVLVAVAGLGILLGATFSGGMMEIAKKGVFNPGMFSFSDVMAIYFSVMVTDVVLLNFCNPMGLPTSTTVSIVFELLGAAVGVEVNRILERGGSLVEVGAYINNEKASEISMLFDNQIVEKITRIKNTELAMAGDGDVTTSAASKIPVIGQYLPSIDLNGNLSHNRSNRVEDTVKVVSSKSTILKPIYEKAKEVRRLDDSKVGNLVKIKDVYLTVVNSDDVMATKALMSGLVNQVPVEGIGNMNFTSLMEVMFKGSAYVLCGELPHRFGTNEHMMLKIPMSAENEMESQYSISDIEIGKVTVLGIYRGEFDRRDVERKINRMMALNDSGKKNQQETNDIQDSGMDIEDGVREEDKNGIRNISLAQGKVHYIDVIAIIQDINI